MGVNGVSHHVVADDLEGAAAVLHWLSSMPPTLGVAPALLPTSDPVERGIGYTAPSGNCDMHCWTIASCMQPALLTKSNYCEIPSIWCA